MYEISDVYRIYGWMSVGNSSIKTNLGTVHLFNFF
jgi:hypothetical protein